MRNFQEVVTKKRWTPLQIKAFLLGKKIKVIGNTNGHSYPMNFVANYPNFTISVTKGVGSVNHLTSAGNNILFKDFIVDYAETKADFLELKKNLEEEHKKEIDALNGKLAYLQANKETVYDEKKHKIYEALKVIQAKKCGIKEKTKILSELLD